MDDVVALGGTFGSAHEPYSVATCRDTLGQLALLHASTWGDPILDDEWLAPRIALDGRSLPHRPAAGPPRRRAWPRAARRAARRRRRCRRRCTAPPSGPPPACCTATPTRATPTATPRAARAGSTGRSPSGATGRSTSPTTSAPCSTVEDRRANEADLLRHYLAELARHGAPAPAYDEAWDAYGTGFTWGYFLWVITSVSSRAVVLEHVPRLGAALADHDTYARLGVV